MSKKIYKYKCDNPNCNRDHEDTDGSNEGADCSSCLDGTLELIEEVDQDNIN